MRDCIHEMQCRREKTGISWQEIGNRAQRDVRTAMRQLDEEANPTLETLEIYARALGGTIHFVPDEWSMNRSEHLITEMSKMSKLIGELQTENKMLKDQAEEQRNISSHRLKRIDELQTLLSRVMDKLLEKI